MKTLNDQTLISSPCLQTTGNIISHLAFRNVTYGPTYETIAMVIPVSMEIVTTKMLIT